MRRPAVLAIRTGYVLLIALVVVVVYPAFKKAKSKSSPGPLSIIQNRLEAIDVAKSLLKDDRHLPDGYWPSRAEVASAGTGMTDVSFDVWLKPTRLGEIYIVNQIGAPAYAYLSNVVGDFPEGVLLTKHDLASHTHFDSAANRTTAISSGTNSTIPQAGTGR